MALPLAKRCTAAALAAFGLVAHAGAAGGDPTGGACATAAAAGACGGAAASSGGVGAAEADALHLMQVNRRSNEVGPQVALNAARSATSGTHVANRSATRGNASQPSDGEPHAPSGVAPCTCSYMFKYCGSDGLCRNWWDEPSTSSCIENGLGVCTADYAAPGAPMCTYHEWPARDAAEVMVLGTWSNMDRELQSLGLDLTGLWWMKGNPLAEVLASFAGTSASSSMYPVTLKVPHNRKEHWSWRSDAHGSSLMKFYSAEDMEATMDISMTSNRSGTVSSFMQNFPGLGVEACGFEHKSEDEWLRRYTFQAASPLSDANYTLTRILRADGSPTRFWDEFLRSEDAGRQQSFGNDDRCMRSCEVVGSCTFCGQACR